MHRQIHGFFCATRAMLEARERELLKAAIEEEEQGVSARASFINQENRHSQSTLEV